MDRLGRGIGASTGTLHALIITLEQAAGFGMFMLKAVITGRGDELIDLAKVNLFR